MPKPILPDNLGSLKSLAEAALAPTIRLRVGPEAASLAPGASRFGGHPLAPPGFNWPRNRSGRPIEFLGQLNFAEVAAQAPAGLSPLPNQGLFQVFYDVEEMPGLCRDADPDFWRFVWYPSLEGGAAGEGPAGPSLPEQAHPIRFEFGHFSLPNLWTLIDEDEGPVSDPIRKAEYHAYVALQDELERDNRPRHQLLGHPVEMQYDPRWDLLSTLGFGGIRHSELRRHYFGDWQLLWQIDSDDDLGYMWGDAGLLYVYVRRISLSEGDLSRAWLTAQCT